MDGLKTFKWIIGWKDKPKQVSQIPDGENPQMNKPSRMPIVFSEKVRPLNPVRYPLPPVQDSPPIKKLPGYLLPKKKTREGWY